MLTISADEQSFNDLDKALKRLQHELERHVIEPSLKAAAEVVLEEAQATAAFQDDTGELRRSMRVESVPAKDMKHRGKNAKDVLLEATAEYAAAVELGHGGPRPAPPKPYLRPALKSRQKAAVKAAQRVARKGLPRAVRAARNAGS